MAPDAEALKDRVIAEVDRRADVLVDASHQIHAQPELGYEEHFAHELLTGILEAEGLAVERGAYGLETAFEARVGRRGPDVAVLCEYDALPGIGHACGHNIIATAGLGAGLAAAALAEEAGGRVVILGTPAEEGGGGKVLMAERGAFDGVDAAMMVHPAGADLHGDERDRHPTAATSSYSGEAAHAAAFPHRGRNALDAAVLGYVNVAALRQHIRPDRAHPRHLHRGRRQAEHRARPRPGRVVRALAQDRGPSKPLKARVLACLEAGAAAAGCTMELRVGRARLLRHVDNAADDRAVPRATRPGWARTLHDPERRQRRGRGQHRHGQRQLPRSRRSTR